MGVQMPQPPDFAEVVFPGLPRRIYDMIWAQESQPGSE